MNNDKNFFRGGMYVSATMIVIGATARISQGHPSESTGILLVGGIFIFLVSAFGYIVNYNNNQ